MILAPFFAGVAVVVTCSKYVVNVKSFFSNLRFISTDAFLAMHINARKF